MKEHAKLSPSQSSTWTICAGSVEAQAHFPYQTNVYAEEGKLAHSLAERMFFKQDYSDLNVSNEMIKYVEKYINHLNSIPTYIENKTYIEKKIDLRPLIPECYGTADAIVLQTTELHDELYIIDLKYGHVKVDSTNNTQLLLYAIGVVNNLILPLVSNIQLIHLDIVQPKLDSISRWTITMQELKWWEGYLKSKAEEALRPGALRTPHEKACKYCKAAPSCPALYNVFQELPIEPAELSDDQLKNVIDNTKLITNFLAAVEEKIYERFLTGDSLKGYKLVEGKKVRKLKVDSEEKLVEMLGEAAYNKNLVGIGELEKLLDKKTLASLVYTSINRPLLVKENDKREPLVLKHLEFEPV